jgi:hypothetical protein
MPDMYGYASYNAGDTAAFSSTNGSTKVITVRGDTTTYRDFVADTCNGSYTTSYPTSAAPATPNTIVATNTLPQGCTFNTTYTVTPISNNTRAQVESTYPVGTYAGTTCTLKVTAQPPAVGAYITSVDRYGVFTYLQYQVRVARTCNPESPLDEATRVNLAGMRTDGGDVLVYFQNGVRFLCVPY